MANGKYKINKYFRISEAQAKKLQKDSMKCGLTESQYLRQLIMGNEAIDQESYVAMKELTYEINKIGNNINQIVRNNNSELYSGVDKERLRQNMKN